MEKNIAVMLCKLERIFIPAFFDVMVHLAVHLATEAKLVGLVMYRWMYPFERYVESYVMLFDIFVNLNAMILITSYSIGIWVLTNQKWGTKLAQRDVLQNVTFKMNA